MVPAKVGSSAPRPLSLPFAGSVGVLQYTIVGRKLGQRTTAARLARSTNTPNTGDPRFRIGGYLDRAAKPRPRKED